ncbi:hypothetical protein IAG25_32935 [Caballeronia sp. EK]|uniref:hypothetical protein n=1 Tax=Caballeronia sp. EK TaxID=2767469 RepID=UPI0016556134|nr:hypothetical protein [Caballeronia sp. EK]MBC8641632.1 hypothetical protein [Caballeronia sp. EK]
MNVSDPPIDVSKDEMRNMCNMAAKALLEHFTAGTARITDLGVYVPVDFHMDTRGDTRHRFEVAMMALFDRRKDTERFDACGLVKRDGSYGVTVRFDLPNFSARFFPKHERLQFFHSMAVREVAATVASQCSSDYAIALERHFPDPRSAFERAIRASIGQYGAIRWKSEAERGEMSRYLEAQALDQRVNGSSARVTPSSMFEQSGDRPLAGKMRN